MPFGDRPYYPDGTHKLTPEYVQRELIRISDALSREQIIDVTDITNTDSPYDVRTGDKIINADATSGAITINLQIGKDERVVYIKNIADNGLSDVTITPNGSDDIERIGGNLVLPPLTSARLTYSESAANWFIYDKFYNLISAGSTDNAIVRFDGTTGLSFQNSGVLIDDSDNITGVTSLTATDIETTNMPTVGSVSIQDTFVDAAGDTMTGPLLQDDTTTSTTPTTGSIQTDGGLGVVENVYIGGDLGVAGHMALGNAATVSAQNILSIDETTVDVNGTHTANNINVTHTGTDSGFGTKTTFGLTNTYEQTGGAGFNLLYGFNNRLRCDTAANIAVMVGHFIQADLSNSGDVGAIYAAQYTSPGTYNGGYTGTVTSAAGIIINNQVGSGVTTNNAYGLKIDAQAGAVSENYGIVLEGDTMGAGIAFGGLQDSGIYGDRFNDFLIFDADLQSAGGQSFDFRNGPLLLTTSNDIGATGTRVNKGWFTDLDTATLTTTGTAAFDNITVGGGYGSTGVTISNAGVVQADGAITSDATVTGATLTDGTLSSTAGALTGVVNQTFTIGTGTKNITGNDGIFRITGGTGATTGTNLLLYGESNPNSGNIIFRNASTQTLAYNKSITAWDFNSNNIINVNDLTVNGAFTSQGIDDNATTVTLVTADSGSDRIVTIPGSTTEVRQLRVGHGRSGGDGNSFVDLVSDDATYTSFGLRLGRYAGGSPNGNSTLQHRGTGALQLTAQDAGTVQLRTSDTTRVTVDDDEVTINTGLSLKVTSTAATTYAALASDNIILADTGSNAITINLPAGVDKKTFTIKNIGFAAANAVTVDGSGAETIDGTTTITINQPDSVTIVYSSSDSGWFIV